MAHWPIHLNSLSLRVTEEYAFYGTLAGRSWNYRESVGMGWQATNPTSYSMSYSANCRWSLMAVAPSMNGPWIRNGRPVYRLAPQMLLTWPMEQLWTVVWRRTMVAAKIRTQQMRMYYIYSIASFPLVTWTMNISSIRIRLMLSWLVLCVRCFQNTLLS